jgi:hypothetical protein
MTRSDKQKGTSGRPHLRIVQSSSTDATENPQDEVSSSSDSTTSSTSTDTGSEQPGARTKAEREEFLSELQEFLDLILHAAHDDQITGIAFITINGDHSTTGTAYTQSCKYDSHLTIAGIETLRYRFIRTFMDEQ